MDKGAYNVKAEKIQKAVKQGNFEAACKLCDSVDWTQVSSVRMLSLVSSVYEHVQQYDTAIDILLMAYEQAPTGKRFLYKLTELAIAAGNIPEAEDYYKKFSKEAPEDSSRYILRYKLAEARGESLEKRIAILETYKRREFDEEWAYNLAMLYHKAGEEEKCVALCDEIILWFGVGTYVDRAMTLKEQHQALTEDQMDHRINRAYYEDNLKKVASQMARGGDPEAAEKRRPPAPQQSAPQTYGAAEPAASAETPGIYADEDMNAGETRRLPNIDDMGATRVFATVPTDSGAILTAAKKLVEDDRKDSIPAPEPAPRGFGNNVIAVSAASPTEGLQQAIDRLKEAHEVRKERVAPMAKISGSRLNERGLKASLRALLGKDLVIMGASALSDEMLGELAETAEMYPGMFFILADSAAGIDRLNERIYPTPEEPEEPEVPEETELPAAQVLPEEPAVQEGPETAEAAVQPEPAEREIEAAVLPEFLQSAAEKQKAADLPELVIPDTVPDVSIAPEDITDGAIMAAAEEPEEPIAFPDYIFDIQKKSYQTEEASDAKPVRKPVKKPIREPFEPDEVIKNKAAETLPQIMAEEADFAEEPREMQEQLPEMPAVEPGDILEEDAFIACMKEYAARIDCVLSENAEDGIFERLDILYDKGVVLTADLARSIVEEAADNAEAASISNMFKKKYDKEGNLILRAGNFY